jgi:ribonucleoside-diphosphate reductase alpha chain
VLPYDGGNYTQAPFQDCSKETYEALLAALTDVDLTKIVELDDNTDLSGELACAAGNCEVR